jgi:sulfite reductase (ferredoxin)
MPTCGLALADSERALPEIVDSVHAELRALDLEDELVTLRITGCPNGCVRPYNCDIGIVGRQPGVYTLFLGGDRLADRLSFEFADFVPQAEIASRLRGPLARYRKERTPGETFGAWCTRLGKDALVAMNGDPAA